MENLTLEQTVKKYESLHSVKAYCVDTSARILFYVPLLGLYEKYMADFDNEQLIKSRLSGLALNVLLARFHGVIRESVSGFTSTSEQSSGVRKFAADSLSGLLMSAVTYPAVLVVADANWQQAITALPFAFGIGMFAGRPFGKFLDWYRNLFGTRAVYDYVNKTDTI